MLQAAFAQSTMNCGTQWILSEKIPHRRDFSRSLAIVTPYGEFAMQWTTCSNIQSLVTGLFGLMQYLQGHPTQRKSATIASG